MVMFVSQFIAAMNIRERIYLWNSACQWTTVTCGKQQGVGTRKKTAK